MAEGGRTLKRLLVTIASGVIIALAAASASAQAVPAARPAASPPPQQAGVGHPPDDTDYVPPPRPPSPRIASTAFVIPDLPDAWKERSSYDGRLFSTGFSVVALVDYNAFVQDSDSKTQVGEQSDEWDLRTMRLMFRGRMKFRHPVDYFISVEVKGQDHVQDDESQWGLTDWEFSTQLGKLGRLKYGKVKEPFSYELVGDSGTLQQQERALNPFFASRGTGLRLTNSFADDSMTWSVGWFNDWWVADQSFEVSGNNFAARFTGVPYFDNGGADYLHLGIGTRYIGADEGTLRFRGRPESNVADYYVDSGTIAADHANSIGLEFLHGRGPFLVSAEWARNWVDAPLSGDPSFWGGYIVVSYVLTGEHRPYDRKLGYARRVMPERRIGAFELVGRYTHVDVDDALVAGGIFDRATLGINWWATRRWKIGFDYGVIDLHRGGLDGLTHAFHTRIQWIY